MSNTKIVERFECCFENDYKGIYFDVTINKTHVDFSMFNDFEFETSVCLRKDDVERLIKFLQSYT